MVGNLGSEIVPGCRRLRSSLVTSRTVNCCVFTMQYALVALAAGQAPLHVLRREPGALSLVGGRSPWGLGGQLESGSLTLEGTASCLISAGSSQ